MSLCRKFNAKIKFAHLNASVEMRGIYRALITKCAHNTACVIAGKRIFFSFCFLFSCLHERSGEAVATFEIKSFNFDANKIFCVCISVKLRVTLKDLASTVSRDISTFRQFLSVYFGIDDKWHRIDRVNAADLWKEPSNFSSVLQNLYQFCVAVCPHSLLCGKNHLKSFCNIEKIIE